MANKNESKEPIPAKGGGSLVRWAAIGVLIFGVVFFLFASMSEGPATPASSSTSASAGDQGHEHAPLPKDPGQTQKFRYFENPEEAHPLPVTLPPTGFINKGIASTYQIAKEIPEVLAQQPCLCGCDNTSDDHRSLLDCYIGDHASTCLVCMKEAVLAKQMTDAGKSAKEIREAILE